MHSVSIQTPYFGFCKRQKNFVPVGLSVPEESLFTNKCPKCPGLFIQSRLVSKCVKLSLKFISSNATKASCWQFFTPSSPTPHYPTTNILAPFLLLHFMSIICEHALAVRKDYACSLAMMLTVTNSTWFMC